ncbi:hypothetical protein C8T65DRAFT_631813, partial [Cerioporus squamosus]
MVAEVSGESRVCSLFSLLVLSAAARAVFLQANAGCSVICACSSGSRSAVRSGLPTAPPRATLSTLTCPLPNRFATVGPLPASLQSASF